MSERVQLLLSDRILGMTLVPEGRVWNYGIGLTQLWSPNIPFSITLDTPLLFWAEEHRPAAFLTVSYFFLVLSPVLRASDASLAPVRKS
jgi:pre-mRNA-processing factor 8